MAPGSSPRSRLRSTLARSAVLRRLYARIRSKAEPAPREAQVHRSAHAGFPVAVVGLGRQGHAIASALVAMGYRVTGVCDLDRAKAEAFAAKHAGVRACATVEALSETGAQIAIVATLADSRRELLARLGKSGLRRILSEKPIATTVADAAAIRQLSAEYQLNVKLHTPRSYLTEYRRVRQLVADGAIGRLGRIDLRFKPSGFGNMASHFLPLAFDLAGRAPVAVQRAWFGEPRANRHPIFADRNGVVDVLLEHDVLVSADNTERAVKGPAFVILTGDRGRIVCREGTHPTFTVYDARTNETCEYPFGDGAITARDERAVALSVDRALSDLIDDRSDRGLEWALAAVDVVVGAQHAHATGRSVALPLPVDTPSTFLFT